MRAPLAPFQLSFLHVWIFNCISIICSIQSSTVISYPCGACWLCLEIICHRSTKPFFNEHRLHIRTPVASISRASLISLNQPCANSQKARGPWYFPRWQSPSSNVGLSTWEKARSSPRSIPDCELTLNVRVDCWRWLGWAATRRTMEIASLKQRRCIKMLFCSFRL